MMISRRRLAQGGASALLCGLAAPRPAVAAQVTAKPLPKVHHGAPPRPVSAPASPVPPPPAGPALAVLDAPGLAAAQIDLASALILQGATARTAASAAVSPMSLVAALSVVAMGCDEPMRDSLGQALRFPAPLSTKALTSLLGGFVELANLKAGDAAFPLTLANRLVIDPGVEPVPAFLQGLQAYGVDVGVTSLSDPKIVETLNNWVKEKTGNLIPSIIDAPPGAGGLAALNALHFKDRWSEPFDPKNTAPQPFLSTDGRADPFPMMRRSGQFSFGHDGGFAAVELGFGTERFALTLVTSTENPARAADLLKAGRGWLAGTGLQSSPGMVTLPRFGLEHSADLLGPLQTLGLSNRPLVFFGSKPPTISTISQRSMFQVTEAGAEAAAATAVAATRSLDDRFVKLAFDKPFVFALRDRTTGFVLMAGYVDRPDAAQS